MELGAFSVSLSVKDLQASRDFYAKLGFEPTGGNAEQNWLILRNGDHVIGLFTFNPGWDQHGNVTERYTDVRDIQRELRNQGISFASEADENTDGPASFVVIDPDGNPILIDQHR